MLKEDVKIKLCMELFELTYDSALFISSSFNKYLKEEWVNILKRTPI